MAVTEALLHRRLLRRHRRGLSLTREGRSWLEAQGVTVPEPEAGVSDFTTACPDWTEERSLLGGPVGEALIAHWLQRGWLRKVPQGRTLRLTPLGERALAQQLGVALPMP